MIYVEFSKENQVELFSRGFRWVGSKNKEILEKESTAHRYIYADTETKNMTWSSILPSGSFTADLTKSVSSISSTVVLRNGFVREDARGFFYTKFSLGKAPTGLYEPWLEWVKRIDSGDDLV